MPINVTTKESDNTIRIHVIDRFDYSVHKEFREAYKNSSEDAKFVIDMSQASYMDSSALGMLLLLREHLKDHGSNITITGCNAELKKTLEISNFHNLVNIV